MAHFLFLFIVLIVTSDSETLTGEPHAKTSLFSNCGMVRSM